MAGSVSAAALAGAVASPLSAAHQLLGDRARQPDLKHITKATFEALRGERFELYNDTTGQTAEVQLVEIVDEGSNTRLEQFSVQFRSVHHTALTDATYRLGHCSAGHCRLYLQAMADTTGATSLRATFALLS